MLLRSFVFRSAVGASLAASAACSSSKGSDPIPQTTHSMQWNVDGSTVNATGFTSSPQSANNLVTLTGQVTAGAALTSQVMLDVPKAVGTYTFGPSALASGTYITRNPTTQAYYAGSTPGAGTVTGAGTIVVTELTGTSISGTFTFTGINGNTGDAKSVSNGRFFIGL